MDSICIISRNIISRNNICINQNKLHFKITIHLPKTNCTKTMDTYFENKHFVKIIFSLQHFPIGEYDNCSFEQCDFNQADLSNFQFLSCDFTGCTMNMAILKQTSFKTCTFSSCKLMGLHFEDCHPFLFMVNFKDCMLDFSSFTQMKLKNTGFNHSSLIDVDFSSADLTAVSFQHCNLSKALFDQTNLEKADFRTSYNYSIHPEKNKLKKAKFSASGVVGLLDTYQIDIS